MSIQYLPAGPLDDDGPWPHCGHCDDDCDDDCEVVRTGWCRMCEDEL